jgi:uncharacterized protein YlxW (UPF0749 family)
MTACTTNKTKENPPNVLDAQVYELKKLKRKLEPQVASLEERTTYYDPNNTSNQFYHKTAKAQMQKQLEKFSATKQVDKIDRKISRRDRII